MGKFKKIGILSSGGDAPGMNAAIRAVTREAISNGLEVVGIYGGYAGLLEKNMKTLDTSSVSNIVTRGGTMLYSSRSLEFKTEAGLQKAVDICHEQGIDAIVAIGGDGTFRGATALTNRGIPSIGIPGTIDNDITATDYTIGFDTALNTVLEMIDCLRDTCESHARCNVVEVMGRDCGLIALYTGIATGAVSIAIPEVPFDREFAIEKIRASRASGKRGIIAICSEGMPTVGGLKYSEYFAAEVQSRTGIETKFARLGHIIRGGSPLLNDRLIATEMGAEAVKLLINGESNKVMCKIDNAVTAVDINYALILDRMYKGTLESGDLAAFSDAEIASMHARCEQKKSRIERLYAMSYEICMH